MHTIEDLCHECYAAHVLLTNLGFEPDEIFVGVQPVANVSPPGQPHAIVRLVRGRLSFVMHLCSLDLEQAQAFDRAWRAFADAKPGMPRTELDRIVYRTWVWRERANLLAALVHKGFTLEPGRMVN